VNQIFRDLATFVHDQGETIDSIEAHIESSSIRVSEGVQQLQKANTYAVSSINFGSVISPRNSRVESCKVIVLKFSRLRLERKSCASSVLEL